MNVLQTHANMEEHALLKPLAAIHVIVQMDLLEKIVQQVRITKVFACTQCSANLLF